MRQLSIGEARRTGVRTSALRYYEEAGILPTPARLSGRRCYDADAIRRVEVLRFAQQAEFTLREIKTLFRGFGAETPLGARWKSLARGKLRELDVLAERVQRMRRALGRRLKCGCVRIEDCSLSPSDVPQISGPRTGSRRVRAC
jgi:MerR family redox-sensitive transcriptional activator SoxR